MTTTEKSPTLEVTSTVVFSDNGEIDWKLTQAAFEKSVTETVEREVTNETEIREYLHKYATEYVSTDAVVSRLVSRRENASGTELSPSARKVVQTSIENTLENMKKLGRVHAKAGKGGGIQTAGNHALMEQELADKKAEKESKKKLLE